MNETRAVIRLRDLMDSAQGWGREQGRQVFQRLIQQVEASPGKSVIEVSLRGVERSDISFASETVVELAKRYRGSKGFCLTHVADADLLENWDSAAAKKAQPLMVWDAADGRVIGPQPSQGNMPAFEYVLGRGSVTASDLASEFDLQITNASMKLKQLWEQGFVLRRQEIAESGGIEFRYLPIR